ncbi:MAG: rRNA pseudouridine synthase [Oscillospiraceae bacterium]|nr:rRNA pseudouridine synthase [Oscillospiraceae bacterium]
MMRLDRYLSSCSKLTRSQAGRAIREGRVRVDGLTQKKPDYKIDEINASVQLDGSTCIYKREYTFLLNKPAGVVTASRDKAQKTVLDLFPPEIRKLRIFPVGRLDKDTTGLLLLTTDGDLAHRILSPRSGVEKRYRALVEGELSSGDVERFREGITLADGTECLPAHLIILGTHEAEVVIHEGKYHQVRRMFASVGKPVLELERRAIGGLCLNENLARGEFCELSESDLCILFKANNWENSQKNGAIFPAF